MRFLLFVAVTLFSTAQGVFALDPPNDCSDRWHRKWIQDFSGLPRDSWECYRVDRDQMSEGRYSDRWGLGGNGRIEVYYEDQEIYGNWVWDRRIISGFQTEFRASFFGRNWQVQQWDSDHYPNHACFNAVSVRRNSALRIIYCNDDIEADDRYSRPYDRRKVEFLMRNNGVL